MVTDGDGNGLTNEDNKSNEDLKDHRESPYAKINSPLCLMHGENNENVMAKRDCKDYQCDYLLKQNRQLKDLPTPETKGIFVIKERGMIIYAGQSGDCMRDRMLSHLSGYDAQEIGKHLKQMGQEQKERDITIGWVEIVRPRCEEHHYIECIAEKQGSWPEYNKKRGRPKKER